MEPLAEKKGGPVTPSIGNQSSLLVERMDTADRLQVMQESVLSARKRKTLEKERVIKNRSAMVVSLTSRGRAGDYKTITTHRRNNSNTLSPVNAYTDKQKTLIARSSRNNSKNRQKQQTSSSNRNLPNSFKKSPYNLNLAPMPEYNVRRRGGVGAVAPQRDLSENQAYINAVDYLPQS